MEGDEYMEEEYTDDEMDDEELQRALLLSMQEVQPGEEAQGQPAAGNPPAASQAAPQPPAGNMAAQLQFALQQALLQQAAAGGQAPQQAAAGGQAPQQAAPAAAPAPAPAQQPHQQQQQHRAAPAPPQAAPLLKRPSWVAAASQWVASTPAQQTPAGVLLSGPSGAASWEAPLKDALARSLGQPVALITGVGQGGGLGAGTVPVQMFAEGGGFRLTTSAVDALVNRVPAGNDIIQALQGCWLRAGTEAAQAASAQPEVAAALQLLQARVLKKAAGVLASDEDDLFFEGGRYRSTLLAGLANGTVAPAFLDALAASAANAEEGKAWEGVLRDCFGALKGFDFAQPEKHNGALRRLDVVTQCPTLRRCLAALLLREAVAAVSTLGNGRVVEESSILAPLLAISPLPRLSPAAGPGGLEFPAKNCFMQLRGYPGSRGMVATELNSIRRALSDVYAAAHEVCKRIATFKVGDGALKGREVWPAWVAAVCGSNIARAEAGSTEALLRDVKAMRHSSSDGFMVGLLATALRFCRPFMAGAAKKQGALQHLDPAYYAKNSWRVVGVSWERSLAGTMIPPPPGIPFPYLSPESGDEGRPHFIAEMFFLTQRLIHMGLMPTVYKASALAKMLRQMGGGDEDDDDELAPSGRGGASLESYLLADSVGAALMDPDFANDACQFMELQAMWLVSLMQLPPAAAKAAFEAIPESVLADLTAWLSYVIRSRSAELFGGMNIGALMACLAGVLRRTELVPSPKLHYGVVNLLLSMLSPQLYGQRRGARMLAGSHMSAAEGALVSAVLGTGATQSELLPAIMKAYAHADHVVALDVDKDQFDKFSMRHAIDQLLMELWKDPACAASLARVAGQVSGAEELFADFVGATLNDLVYLLKDSLGRLEDIHAMEASMADKAGWAALSPVEQQDKKRFYQGQQRAAGGFMYQAVNTLKMLNTLTAHPTVQKSFLQQPIAGRAANACVHFLDLLVGPRCSGLVVDRPEQYFFSPDQLLLDTAHLMLRLAEHPQFVKAVSEVPDYDEGVMSGVLSALATKQLGEYEHRHRLEVLIASVRQLRGGPSNVQSEEGGPAGASATLDLSFAQPEPQGLEEAYVAALEPLAVGDYDSTVLRAYNRHFAAMAEQAAGDTSAKMKALSRELRNLRGKTKLPIYAASSILVRHDSDRMDKVRALITGPEGTPYYGGCFFFDIFFPQDYPNVPPLMELETTGGGVARFNPNLYGKVCLSLLGTWHGGDESEKWRPGTSTLFQVLLSIQGMIFIEDPYFNEPSYEAIRGTSEGASSSLKYNSELWLNSIRYAMLDVLRHPRPGYEDVIKAHFRLLRHRIMKQCGEWLKQAEALDPLFQKRLRDAVRDLHAALAQL